MKLSQVVAELKAERDKLDKAIQALTGLSKSPAPAKKSPKKPAAGKPRISAAARKKMADAQKRRWDKFRAEKAKKAAAAKKS